MSEITALEYSQHVSRKAASSLEEKCFNQCVIGALEDLCNPGKLHLDFSYEFFGTVVIICILKCQMQLILPFAYREEEVKEI